MRLREPGQLEPGQLLDYVLPQKPLRLHHGSTLSRVFRLCLDLFQPVVVRLGLLQSPLRTGQADVSEILFPNAPLELVALLEDRGGLPLGQRVGAHTQLLGNLLVLQLPLEEQLDSLDMPGLEVGQNHGF